MGFRLKGTCFIPEHEFWNFAAKYLPSGANFQANPDSVRFDCGDLIFDVVLNTECHPSEEAEQEE